MTTWTYAKFYFCARLCGLPAQCYRTKQPGLILFWVSISDGRKTIDQWPMTMTMVMPIVGLTYIPLVFDHFLTDMSKAGSEIWTAWKWIRMNASEDCHIDPFNIIPCRMPFTLQSDTCQRMVLRQWSCSRLRARVLHTTDVFNLHHHHCHPFVSPRSSRFLIWQQFKQGFWIHHQHCQSPLYSTAYLRKNCNNIEFSIKSDVPEILKHVLREPLGVK